jgi:hypothetical protein
LRSEIQVVDNGICSRLHWHGFRHESEARLLFESPPKCLRKSLIRNFDRKSFLKSVFIWSYPASFQLSSPHNLVICATLLSMDLLGFLRSAFRLMSLIMKFMNISTESEQFRWRKPYGLLFCSRTRTKIPYCTVQIFPSSSLFSAVCARTEIQGGGGRASTAKAAASRRTPDAC